MHMRKFSNEETLVSEIGLGTWQLGSDAWGDLTEEKAIEILQQAEDCEINFLDTADVYGGGTSEKRIGKFLQKSNQNYFVATKFGQRKDSKPEHYFSYDTVKRHTEDSLKNLGLSCLDLTQVHCIPFQDLENQKTFSALEKLKQQGLIKNFGASVETIEEAKLCAQIEGLSSIQMIFNIFRQDAIHSFFELALEKKIAIIVRLPLASGILSGKMRKDQAFSDNDHRKFNANGEMFNVGETFSGIPFEKAVSLANELKLLVPKDMSMSQFSLRWILDHPAVTTIIPGASNVDQVISNANASRFKSLNQSVHQQLNTFYQEKVRSFIRGQF